MEKLMRFETSESPEYLIAPECYEVEIDDEILRKIKRIRKLIKEDIIESGSIPYQAEPVSGEWEKQEELLRWNPDCGELIVVSYGVYYYEENKYDHTAQVRTESHTFNDIGINEKETAEVK